MGREGEVGRGREGGEGKVEGRGSGTGLTGPAAQ